MDFLFFIYLLRLWKLLRTHMNVAYVSSVIALPQVPFIPDQSLALRKTNMRNGMLLKKKKKKKRA